jgi:UDP-N-acetylglucosamine 2-epimerase (non-hydrolysing)
VCVTGQHRQMLDQVLEFFKITADYDLNLMKENQTLFHITGNGLMQLHEVVEKDKPDLIFVQGDTTSALIGALAGYYAKIDVAHIEAGLRSFNLYSPYPEEGNRKIVAQLAKYHFTPTEQASKNLFNEGINNNVINVGNTVIDALFLGLDLIAAEGEQKFLDFFHNIDLSKKIILVTGHRRESFGRPFEEICESIKEIAVSFPDIEIVYPVHLNPNVREPVNSILRGLPNVKLMEPLSYPFLIWLMNRCFLVLTDSGGIQEEAPSLGKPVLVMRDVTERMEGVDAGTAMLVGSDKAKILRETTNLVTNPAMYTKMAKAVNPYGDGETSKRILNFFRN